MKVVAVIAILGLIVNAVGLDRNDDGSWDVGRVSTDHVSGPVTSPTTTPIPATPVAPLEVPAAQAATPAPAEVTGGQYNLSALVELAASTGLRGESLVIAVSIAGWSGAPAAGESGGRSDAVGDQHLANGKWGNSYGLWQVRSLRDQSGTGRIRDETRLQDPGFNAQSMYAISDGGSNWRPWTVYTKGIYRANLDEARAAVAAAGY